MPTRRTLHTLLGWAAAIGVLLAVFSLYTRPEFLVALSEQIWACFQ